MRQRWKRGGRRTCCEHCCNSTPRRGCQTRDATRQSVGHARVPRMVSEALSVTLRLQPTAARCAAGQKGGHREDAERAAHCPQCCRAAVVWSERWATARRARAAAAAYRPVHVSSTSRLSVWAIASGDGGVSGMRLLRRWFRSHLEIAAGRGAERARCVSEPGTTVPSGAALLTGAARGVRGGTRRRGRRRPQSTAAASATSDRARWRWQAAGAGFPVRRTRRTAARRLSSGKGQADQSGSRQRSRGRTHAPNSSRGSR